MTNADGSKFDTAKWATTIGHLLANAADTTLPEQTRQEYAAKAADLMSRHGIQEAQARATRGEHAAETAAVLPYAVSGDNGFGQARATVACRVAEAMGCKAIIKVNATPRPCMTHIVGVTADIAALKTLLPLILTQAELAAATRAAAGHRAPSYLSAFLIGYGDAVAERIRARREAYADTTTGTGAGLVLADRARIVANLFTELFAEHITKSPAARHRADGHAAGRQAGQGAQLGDSGIGTTERPALPTS